jgi:hypothetical protein
VRAWVRFSGVLSGARAASVAGVAADAVTGVRGQVTGMSVTSSRADTAQYYAGYSVASEAACDRASEAACERQGAAGGSAGCAAGHEAGADPGAVPGADSPGGNRRLS